VTSLACSSADVEHPVRIIAKKATPARNLDFFLKGIDLLSLLVIYRSNIGHPGYLSNNSVA
jgi:hypothetical protein